MYNRVLNSIKEKKWEQYLLFSYIWYIGILAIAIDILAIAIDIKSISVLSVIPVMWFGVRVSSICSTWVIFDITLNILETPHPRVLVFSNDTSFSTW